MTVSTSLGAIPASFTARDPASTAMSTSDVPSSAMRRLWMPTRSRIHWSSVSMRWARSSLVTTLSGCALPSPVSRAPGAGGGHAGGGHAALQRVRPMSSTAASRSSGVFSASVAVPLRSRLTRPTNVPAGGSSSTAVTPSSRSVAMQASHRTGRVTCATSRRSDLGAAGQHGAVGIGQQRAVRVGGGRGPRRGRAARPRPGAMNRVWNAPATGSRFTLARSGGAASSASSALTGPAATTWPAPFTFAGSRPSPANAAEHLVGLPTQHGAHPGRFERAGGGHLPAPHRGQGDRRVRGKHPGQGGRGQLPDRVAGDRCVGRQRHLLRQPGRGQQRGRHDEWLGDRGVLDLVGGRLGAEPAQVERRRLGPGGQRLLGGGVVEPGSEHAGGLRPLAGREQGDHSDHTTLPRRARDSGTHQLRPSRNWRFPPTVDLSTSRPSPLAGCGEAHA